jgi:hypothetical protein
MDLSIRLSSAGRLLYWGHGLLLVLFVASFQVYGGWQAEPRITISPERRALALDLQAGNAAAPSAHQSANAVVVCSLDEAKALRASGSTATIYIAGLEEWNPELIEILDTLTARGQLVIADQDDCVF